MNENLNSHVDKKNKKHFDRTVCKEIITIIQKSTKINQKNFATNVHVFQNK